MDDTVTPRPARRATPGHARLRRAAHALACTAALLVGSGFGTAGADDTVASTPSSTPAAASTPATAASPAADASAPPSAAFAAPAAVPTAADPALEARMLAITEELRCLVCQNQTIAESHADLAVDLRQQVRELLKRGMDEAQIRRYMTDRYGDFILYRPPFKPTTLVLWLGPLALLAIAVIALIVVLARRSKLADDQFEVDPAWDDEAEPLDAARLPPDTPARPGAPA